MNTVIAAIASTAAFIAGFGISMMINAAVRGPARWSRGDKAASALIVLVFIALIWTVALAKLAFVGWGA